MMMMVMERTKEKKNYGGKIFFQTQVMTSVLRFSLKIMKKMATECECVRVFARCVFNI